MRKKSITVARKSTKKTVKKKASTASKRRLVRTESVHETPVRKAVKEKAPRKKRKQKAKRKPAKKCVDAKGRNVFIGSAKKRSTEKKSVRRRIARGNCTTSLLTTTVPASIRIDLTGHQYGRLAVIGFAGYRGNAPMGRCQCECGGVADYYRANIRSGTSTQCIACCYELHRERSTTHNIWGAPEYRAWERVRKHDDVCSRWSKFENSYEDVGDKPSENHRLIRSVTSRGWNPKNVAWVHRDEVNSLRKNSRMIRFRGTNQTLTAWAKEVGLSPASLRSRLAKGWTVREALTTESLR